MSEEKLYAVKKDDGKYWDFPANSGWWSSKISYPTTTIYKKRAEQVSDERGGHVVTLIEEPKKVVISKEQAEIVDAAHNSKRPASYIILKSNDEELLMNAYVNGYTVAKDKKYLLPMDGTLEENDDNDNFQLYAYCQKGRWLTDEVETDPSYKHHTVTQKELDKAPAWVNAIKPVEVTDDAD
ncbi:DUF1642 domain-containing protein [Lacticaseibacillus paracasei]|uniref:DUF1642 domain-containing protein n=1 Tax=Lacticaseibacillus paracasei TaxID=1597 RepID=UPI001C037CE0|nr:DUF1642 domain-containing protein [Lacticaseibacillus paracasei]MBT9263054.1 DUF1642 domain-containing protein [Lacticaseibacillus paracasei]